MRAPGSARQGFVMCRSHSGLVMSAASAKTRRRLTRSVGLTVTSLTLVLAGCTTSHARPAPKTATTSLPASPSAPRPVSPTAPPVSSPAAGGSGSPAPASSNPAPAVPARTAVTATTVSVGLPIALSWVVALALNGKVIVAGGLDAHQVTTSQTLVFDPSALSIRPGAHLPVAVHDAGAGVVGGAALVVGGGSAASSAAVQAVHADGSAAVVGRLPQVRSDDSVAATSGELYVIGGYDGVHELPGVLATTDGVTFHSVGQLGETVRYGAAYAASGAVWIFGGEHQGQPIADIQRVDTGTGV